MLFLSQIAWFAAKTFSIWADNWVESNYLFLCIIFTINNLFLDGSNMINPIVKNVEYGFSNIWLTQNVWLIPGTERTSMISLHLLKCQLRVVPFLWHRVFSITLSGLRRVGLFWFLGIVCMRSNDTAAAFVYLPSIYVALCSIKHITVGDEEFLFLMLLIFFNLNLLYFLIFLFCFADLLYVLEDCKQYFNAENP